MSKFMGIICLALINIIVFAMTLRALLSWFLDESNPIYSFLSNITEPIITPIRKLLGNLRIVSGYPVDISYLVTLVILIILRTVLETWF